MKRVKNYLGLLILMMAAFFIVENHLCKASEQVVINPSSSGEASNMYEGIQYTRARDIIVKINIDESELALYDDYFDICEVIPASSIDNVVAHENCSYYYTENGSNAFQISGRHDGEKVLNIYFYSSYENKAKSKTITKTIVLDTTGPLITLNGGEYIYIPLVESYEELGATCVDDSGYTGAECSVTIGEANIDMKKQGYQYIRYTAVDFLGNEENVLRKVLVEIEEEKSNSYLYWVGAGIGIAILAAFLFIHVWKYKEKQKNQSVL